MLKVTKKILKNQIEVMPIGDLHLGSRQADIKLFQKYIKYIYANSAYMIIMGDIFDVATLSSPTSPYEQSGSLNEYINMFTDLIAPIKHKVLGIISGNHEDRLKRYANFNPLQQIADFLKIPYDNYSLIVELKIGIKNRISEGFISQRQTYVIYAHHTRSSANTLGSKLTKIQKLRNVFEGADVYVGAHTHAQTHAQENVFYLARNARQESFVKERTIHYINSGSFVKFLNNYSEAKPLTPSTLGAPIITLHGSNEKKIEIKYL